MAVSYLAQHFGADLLNLQIPFVTGLDARDVELVLRMLVRGVNSPLTSSCGRLFDAVAALVGIRNHVNYEAQAAIELEMLARDSSDRGSYPLTILEEADSWVIDTCPLFEELLRDLERRVPVSTISRRFHLGLVQVFTEVALRVRARSGLDCVCLSGGTFQNALLFEHFQASLMMEGFRVFGQREVPAGDGGLSLGQAVVAAHRLRSFQDHGG
jgi:hydrogenase maturation protein HypF